MIEGGDGSRLAFEASPRLRRVGEVGRKDLDGDITREACVSGKINVPHATRAQLRQDLVGAKSGAGGQAHVPGILALLR
jgi:hypothetical protein